MACLSRRGKHPKSTIRMPDAALAFYGIEVYPNPPPDFTTFLFYDTYAFFLITSKVADARQTDLKNGGSSTRSRIRHTSQGDAAAANAAGGILMENQGCTIRVDR